MIVPTHEVTIWESEQSRNPDTGRTETGWNAIATQVEINLQPLREELRQALQGERDYSRFIAFFPYDSVVEEDHRLTITSGRDYGPLKVLFVADPGHASSGRWKLEVELVKTDENVS